VYPADSAALPAPVDVPWLLKPVSSADSGIDVFPDGRRRFWIRHDIVKGVTPRMLAWWFAHLEGDIVIGSRRYNRDRVWHPLDHVHASYAWRLDDGSVDPGAAIRLHEVLGRDLRHVVNVTSRIEKLDEEGFIHNPELHIVRGAPRARGLASMEYTFTSTPTGTLYENSLTLGQGTPSGRLATRLFLPAGHGEIWIKHNVEEVGAFEEFLPSLYYKETGRRI
jgi:hypothetical protein